MNGKTKPTHAYFGRCRGCSALVTATVDAPEDAREVAKDVARYMRSGLQVERLPITEAKGMRVCDCEVNPRTRKALPQPALPLDRTCAECGHVHAGMNLGSICIGCPCPNRPGVRP